MRYLGAIFATLVLLILAVGVLLVLIEFIDAVVRFVTGG
jgi:hypothetical protein